MLPVVIIPALKYFFMVSAPWLAGGMAVGFLSGRQEAEQNASRLRQARQQAQIDHLKAKVQTLAEQLQERQVVATPAAEERYLSTPNGEHLPIAPPVAASVDAKDPKKTSLLKQFLQANLALRKNYSDNNGESSNG